MFNACSHPSILVYWFHKFFSLPIDAPDDKHNKMRATLIEEEAAELVQAILDNDREAIAKELGDMVFVVYGCAATLSIDIDLAVEKVFESNMSKLVNGKPLMREDGKVLKGPNYQPPDMSGCV